MVKFCIHLNRRVFVMVAVLDYSLSALSALENDVNQSKTDRDTSFSQVRVQGTYYFLQYMARIHGPTGRLYGPST